MEFRTIGYVLCVLVALGNLGSSMINIPPKIFPKGLNGLSSDQEPVIPYEFPSDPGNATFDGLSALEKPPKIFPDEESRNRESKEDLVEERETLKKAIVPFEFPETDEKTNYTFVVNSTIRENLASRAKQPGTGGTNGVDTEAADLLHGGLEYIPEDVTDDNVSKGDEKTNTTPENPNEEVEMIQEIGSKVGNEDGSKIAEERNLAEMHADHGHPQRIGVPIIHGQLAIVMSFVFVAVAAVAYIALITWRKYLENRYGNRELLVNEDAYDPTDLRNFEL